MPVYAVSLPESRVLLGSCGLAHILLCGLLVLDQRGGTEAAETGVDAGFGCLRKVSKCVFVCVCVCVCV